MSETKKPTLWLRHETKENEERTACLPHHVKALVEAGFDVVVEESDARCVPTEQYAETGARIVPSMSWQTSPDSAVIVGLKELPEEDTPLPHTHIYFSHCYKSQEGWAEVLGRHQRGNGLIYDLEFLVDDEGRRVAAFGHNAGFVGGGLAVLNWITQQESPQARLPPLALQHTSDRLVELVRSKLPRDADTDAVRYPRIVVIGALGRCGRGAVTALRRFGVPEDNIAQWDMAETAKGGPFPEIVEEYDILLNCIYLRSKIPPFVTRDMLDSPTRKLSVVVDVSCDPNNPNNPLPFYHEITTFDDPTIRVVHPSADGSTLPLDVNSIDHMPSMIGFDSSQEFGDALLPHLLEYPNSPVWERAKKLYNDMCAKLPTK